MFIKEHPLCAECLRKGRVTASQDIHHKRSPFNYKDGTINWQLAYDENNLEALCKQCHQEEHNRKHASPEDILKNLEEIMKAIPD